MSTPRIAVIDYGAGNVASVAKALRHAGAEPHVTASAADLDRAHAIIVPGVGHFQKTEAISHGMRNALGKAVARRTPVLGVCLGLHWLFEGSAESAATRGLGLVAGRCFPLEPGERIKVPHVGWNLIRPTGFASRLLPGLSEETFVYFCHSYAAPVGDGTTAIGRHGRDFSAIVERDCVFGVQFHPEMSGAAGIQVLRNFLRVATEVN